jgi:hypothetical protein
MHGGRSDRHALDLRAALKLGVRISLDEIRADEFWAMVVLEDESEKRERSRLESGSQ